MPRDGDGVFTLQHDLVADKEAIPPVPPSAERFQEILDDIAAQINDLEPASDITAQLAGKANVADVDAALALKADTTDLEDGLAGKVATTALGVSVATLSGGHIPQSQAPTTTASAALPVATRAALAALDTTATTFAYLSESGREGFFAWKTGNYATIVATDTEQGLYVASDAVAATSGAWVRVHDDTINIMWFGAGTTNDQSAIQCAFNVIGSNQTLVFPALSFAFDGVVVLETDSITIDWQGTTFVIGDTGSSATLVDGISTGQVGFHFKQSHSIHLIGSAMLVGNGTPGTTSLCGMVFDECQKVNAPAAMRFESMACGRLIINCSNGVWGSCAGLEMYGLQTFEDPPTSNAGSTEVVVGCVDCTFGDAIGKDTEKPVRYLSVASDLAQTERCTFGSTIAYGRTGSATATALAIRNGRYCAFGPVIVVNTSTAVSFVQYPGDTVECTLNTIASVLASAASTAASVDAAVSSESTGNAIGENFIGNVVANASGEYGILVTSGVLSIDSATMSGSATRLACVYSSGFATLRFGSLTIKNNSGLASPVSYGVVGILEIGLLTFDTGPAAALTAGIRFESGLGSGTTVGGYVSRIRYRQNGSANNYVYVAMDLTNSFETFHVGHIDAETTPSSGYSARFASDNFNIQNGRMISSQAPTSGTYIRGQVVWLNNAASGLAPGWICTTAGTPGTWTPMPTLGEVRATADVGGAASANALTNASNVTANSTGVGTIKFEGATNRDSSGFIKIYIGTTAYYVPVFSAITG